MCDGLKAGGAYGDDAQVVEIVRLGKFYPELQDSGPSASASTRLRCSPWPARTRTCCPVPVQSSGWQASTSSGSKQWHLSLTCGAV